MKSFLAKFNCILMSKAELCKITKCLISSWSYFQICGIRNTEMVTERLVIRGWGVPVVRKLSACRREGDQRTGRLHTGCHETHLFFGIIMLPGCGDVNAALYLNKIINCYWVFFHLCFQMWWREVRGGLPLQIEKLLLLSGFHSYEKFLF